MPVLAKVADLASGDRIVAVDEGMWHTREIHSITKAGAVTLVSGEKMKLSGSVLAIRAVDVSDTVDLTDKIDDPRDRDDLRGVERALARVARYGLDPSDPLYYDVYHGAPEWRENLVGRGVEIAEQDAQ